MAVSIQVVNPAHHDANKKCTSATCCAPSKIWKAIQTIIATDDKAALEKLLQNKNRAAHVKDVILASRLPNDASRYPPSHKHRILQFNKDIRFEASAKFGKSVTDLNALQVALLHSKEDMAMQILTFMRQHAEPGELRLFIHHVWGARNTSLHLAGFLGMPRLARTLLELGADPSATNARNLTAADCTKDAETLAILATHASKPTAAVAMSNSTKTRHQLDFLKKAPMAIEPGTTLCPPSDDAVPPPLDGNNSASDTDDASEDGTQQVLPWGAPALSAYYSASVDGHRKAFNPFNLPWLSAHPESQDCIGADNDGWGQHPATISPYVLQASEELVPQETRTEYKEAQDKSETSITDHCVLSPPTAKQQHQDYQHLAVAKQDCMDAAKTAAPFKRCDAQDHGTKKAFDVDCFDLLRVKCDKHRSSSALECLFAACCSNHGTDCLDWLSDGGKSPSALDQLFAINCSQDWLSMVDDYGKSASLLGNLVGTDDQGIDDWLDNVDGWCILALERCSGKWKHDSFRDDASLLRDKHDWLDSGDLERLFTDWRDPAKSVCWYDWLDDFADRNNSPGILGCLFDNPQGINNFKDTDCEFGSPHDRDPGRRIFASSIWKHHAQDKAEPSDNGWCSLDPSLQGHSNMQDGSSGDPGKWKHSSSLTDSPGDTFSCSHDSPWKNSNPSRFSNKNNQWRDYSASESRGLSPCATAAIAGVHHRQGYQLPGHVYQQECDSRLHHRGNLKQVKLPWVLSSSDTNSDKHGWGNPPPVNKTAWNRSALYDHCDARHGSAAVTDTIGLDRHLSRSPDDNKTRLLLLHQLFGHILETWWKTHHPTTTLRDPHTNDWVWHHDCRHDAFNVKNPIQDGGNVLSGSTSQVAVF